MARISILITGHNTAQTIAESLRSVAREAAAAESQGWSTEIVLVDDRSTDGTSTVASGLGISNLRVVSIGSREGDLSARQNAIHRGVLAARGEVIVIIDADVEVPSGWLRAIRTAVEHEKAEVVGGGVAFAAVTPGLVQSTLAALQTTDAAYYLAVCRLLHAIGVPSGLLFGNAAFSRACYLRTGGFPTIGFALTEDLAFARAAHRLGARFAFVPRPAVVTRGCQSWGELLDRAKRVSSGGVSALAVVLGVWNALLPLLAAAALSGGVWPVVLLARYVAGCVFAAGAVARVGRPALMPWALVYEPAAIVAGICVLWKVWRDPAIEWGGVRYDRRSRSTVETA